jgi:TolB-like protein/class 3 adenylate cyclase/Tfp pilus assembly protein PilF
MSAEIKKEVQLEIAHVLFIDIVGYSKLSINDQHAAVGELNRIVRASEQFQRAEAANRLIRIPTGDGMVLVFYTNPEAPTQCAVEISRSLKEHPRLQLRMGIHSGPVSGVVDVNERANLAGPGINMAKRVMDCGDAGHILLSKHVAEDLEEYEQWRPLLHDLGTCDVKHGVRVSMANLYGDQFGSAKLPRKFETFQKRRTRLRWAEVAVALLVLAAIIAAFVLLLRKPARSVLAVTDKSIAVLPFENLSEEKANAFFADGVQDQILTNLAQIADLKVISRTSVMQYKSGAPRNLREIGQQLGVAHVVEGSVQRAANKVRVIAQLIDARSDAHLWAQTYDRDLADVFAIQSEIAKAIADQLQATLSPNEKKAIEQPPTTDLAAFDLYQHAQALVADTTDAVQAREKLPQAAQLLNEALARDPNFLQAWCLLSRVHSIAYFRGHDHTRARLDLAKTALDRAIRLQPDAGEIHLASANYYYQGFRDYERARSELAIARKTLPNNANVFLYTGLTDRREGHWEEATRNMERARELDPRNDFILQQLALAYSWQHRYAEAAQIYDRAVTIVPADPNARVQHALVRLDWQADIKPFRTTLAGLMAEDPSMPLDIDTLRYSFCDRASPVATWVFTNYPREGAASNGVNYPYAYWQGVLARFQGDSPTALVAFAAARREVQNIVDQQSDFAAAISLLGMIDAGLDKKEEALKEGQRACELLPISKDAIDGASLALNLAQIYTWLGDKDRAIEQVATLERVPNPLSYGLLKLHPLWDPLRGDPRFERIVESLAPKNQ